MGKKNNRNELTRASNQMIIIAPVEIKFLREHNYANHL
jgi:hypothetical protein